MEGADGTTVQRLVQKMIPVHPGLYQKMKELSKRQSIPLYEAMYEAMRSYIQNLTHDFPELGEIQQDEKTFLEDALLAYRMRSSNKMVGETVNAFRSMLRV